MYVLITNGGKRYAVKLERYVVRLEREGVGGIYGVDQKVE